LTLAGMGVNSIPMAPVTALCFILTSFVSLILLQKHFNPILSKVILSTVFIVCLLILIDTLNDYKIEIESFFGNSPGLLFNFPIGRMSPVTSVLFLFSSVSLFTITTKNNWKKLALHSFMGILLFLPHGIPPWHLLFCLLAYCLVLV